MRPIIPPTKADLLFAVLIMCPLLTHLLIFPSKSLSLVLSAAIPAANVPVAVTSPVFTDSDILPPLFEAVIPDTYEPPETFPLFVHFIMVPPFKLTPDIPDV